MQGGDGVGEQGIVAIRRFNEDLRFVGLARAGFQRFQAADALVFVGRDVAFEGETLPVCA